MAVFEDKFMQQIIQNRLDILDTIRKIEIRRPGTLYPVHRYRTGGALHQ